MNVLNELRSFFQSKGRRSCVSSSLKGLWGWLQEGPSSFMPLLCPWTKSQQTAPHDDAPGSRGHEPSI